jgi:outer membrane receptor protein involved in Fe transport
MTVVLSARVLCAQTTASLAGTVTIGGQPLGGVAVTISSPTLQGARFAVTGNNGTYHFPALPPGQYRVEFEGEGLTAATVEVPLRLSQAARADAVMHPVESAATLTITAPATSVLESPAVSTSLPLVMIERLPLQRNQLATVQFAPGVTANGVSNGQLQISGGPGYDNLVLVNGVVVTENTRGQIRPMYVEDAIQETTVLTGAISAEYGRFTGGVVNTITKSGGNDLRASLRDSLSSPRWSAQTPAGEARESTLSHVWEGTLGGSVLRDRLWFFTAGRWAKNDTARQTVAVPGFATPPSPVSTAISYAEENDQKRYEGKLTAQAGERHSMVGSYFAIDTQGSNVRFNNNIYDQASLTTRDDPESLGALQYQGLLTSNALIEGHYSQRRFSDRTGAFATDLVHGTVLLDRANNNTRFNAPTLCGVCDVERRDNEDWLLRGRAFFDSGRAGTHDLVAGVDRFTESRYANNHQSGSDFSLFVTRVQASNGVLYPVVTPTTQNGGGTFIRWNPVLVPASDNEVRTDSAYLNDTWSPGRRWELSAGVRWDRNRALDADGVTSANDRKFSPRLGIQYDLRGDGRQHASVSYGEYASRIADSIASSNQAAGNAASIDFAYRGPAINDKALTATTEDVLRAVFDFFNSTQGGTANRAATNLRPNGTRTIPGYAAYFDGTLASPYVREVTAGYGVQLGAHGYVRTDAIARDWRDFYAASITTDTRRTNTPLGIPVDLTLIRNSNRVRREYRALQLQARWSPGRLDSGVHYTYATLRGNDEGDSPASGAVANLDPSFYYPEFFNFARNNPEGYLPGDQRHRVRAWASSTFDVGRARLSASLLHNFDSALPYSIAAPVNLTRYSGAPANPGYAAVPNGLYYFSGRGELRADDIHSTDLALRTAVWIGAVECFVQGDLLNVFNRDGIADPQRLGTTVNTAANSATLLPFDPRTEAPVEGTHYQLAANFGQPLNDLAYQRPRTVRVSLGFRF